MTLKLKFTFIFLLHAFGTSIAQTKVRLSLAECEAAFQKNNLFLLASQFGIEEKRALVLQAKKWDNPYFTAELNAYNPDEKRFFDVGSQGQKVFAIEQLIKIGGKIKNQVELSRKFVSLAEMEYNDLVRNLQFALRRSYYNVYFDLQNLQILENQLNSLDTLIKSYKKQVEKGNISLRDLVRLQSLSLKTQNEWSTLRNDIISEQENITIITGIDSLVIPAPDNAELAGLFKTANIDYSQMINLALTNRPDIKALEEIIKINQQNIKFQKSNAIPDLTLGGSYDQRGGAFNNQIGLTLGVPLPIYNQNQGNIRAAKFAEKSAEALKDQKINDVKAEVLSVINRYRITEKSYNTLSTQFIDNYEFISKSIYENFQKQNITLIEFTDFIESYNESLLEISRIKKSLATICEELNYVTASKIY